MTTTAVVLARGLGTRMRRTDGDAALSVEQQRAAAGGAKALMPMVDASGRARPFLDWILSGLADAGITHVVLVVAPEHEAAAAYYTGEGRPARVTITFAVQEEAIGTANAVLAVEHVVPDRFVVMNGDNLYPHAALAPLVAGDGALCVAFDGEALVREGNIPAERLRAFARLSIGADDVVQGITEKPADADIATLDWPVSMNLWAFTREIFGACRAVPRSARGEFELPQAVDLAVRSGAMRLRALRVAAPVLDLSGRGDIIALGARLATVQVAP
ncbi:MAG: sugar phosphate nucleotidyltransferase [Gemmatimonadaceae bacterium]|jgi:glucose-1-phosphate thymidylyltransferase|nr:sugar phosphate nucleotidyltransferase [Gemmatimonadaceae bacterium]